MGRKKPLHRQKSPDETGWLDPSLRDLRALESRKTFEAAHHYVVRLLMKWHIPRGERDSLAEDILADTLTARERFDPRQSNVRQYLYGIAHHKTKVFQRSLRRKPLSFFSDVEAPSQDIERDLIADSLSPEQAVYARELLASCEAAAPEQREALRLCAEGYTIDEIRGKTGLTKDAVEYFLFRTRKSICDGPGEPGTDDPSDVRICAALPAFSTTMRRNAAWPSAVKLLVAGVASAAAFLLPLLRPSAPEMLAISTVPEVAAASASAPAPLRDTPVTEPPVVDNPGAPIPAMAPARLTPSRALGASKKAFVPRPSALAKPTDLLLLRAHGLLVAGERDASRALATEHGRRYPHMRPADRQAVVTTAAAAMP